MALKVVWMEVKAGGKDDLYAVLAHMVVWCGFF
jgi:hypothetical protein